MCAVRFYSVPKVQLFTFLFIDLQYISSMSSKRKDHLNAMIIVSAKAFHADPIHKNTSSLQV